MDSSVEPPVLRVLDTRTSRVFREIPIHEFLDYARTHKNIAAFLVGWPI